MLRLLVSRTTTRIIGSAVLWGSPILFCQNPAPSESSYIPHMAFDVASIRESSGGDGSYIDNVPKSRRYHAESVPAAALIMGAYHIKIAQRLEHVPEWAWTTRYTVSATSDHSADDALAKLSETDSYAEKRHMLQLLLAERFHLRIHAETRTSTTYELVSTERAAKFMTPVQGDVAKTAGTCPAHRANGTTEKKGLEIESQGCPFPVFLSILQQDLGADILDRTGMTGMYAFHLRWKPASVTAQDNEDWYPSLSDALREQLGLELKETKGPVTFWIVDHMEHPTPQ